MLRDKIDKQIQLRKGLKTKQIVIKRKKTKSNIWKNWRKMKLKKNLILWVISNKKIVIKKDGPNLKENKIEGLHWKFGGLSMKIKEEREMKKKIVDTKPEVHWPHALPRDGGDTKMIQISSQKPVFGSWVTPHTPSEELGRSPYTFPCNTRANYFLFLNSILYLFRY